MENSNGVNQHIKTWVGTIIVIIIAITVGAFVWLSQKDKPIETNIGTVKTVNKSATSSQTTKSGDQAVATTTSNDADVSAIENDLNSVNDEDFGDAALSDQNVGL